MKTTDTYQSQYFAADLLEWDDATGFGICTLDYTARAMGADAEITAEEYLFEYGVDTIDGREMDGVIVVPLGSDIVALLSRLDADFEAVAREIDAECAAQKIWG
jgi:hypothetical protein